MKQKIRFYLLKRTYIVCLSLLLASCGSFIDFDGSEVNEQQPTISGLRIENNQIIITGVNMDTIERVLANSVDLNGYLFQIENQNTSQVTLNVFHQLGNALNISVDSILSFMVETAYAQQQVSVNLDGVGVPTGAVMPFNLATCPNGWVLMDGNNSTLDMRGRAVIGSGQGAGLNNYNFQEQNGVESNTLSETNLPSSVLPVTGSGAILGTTNDAILDEMAPDSMFGTAGFPIYTPDAMGLLTVRMKEGSVDLASLQFDGANDTPVNNMQPYTALIYCQKD
ncbi:MAG TPA: hypothetical protein PKC21_02850 [Oligoflexia bacterium]|nr:hypothetical protein [Oligoflexia bacterium]HMR24271.1 hypothetical protein [Oligoflexia bacterium]